MNKHTTTHSSGQVATRNSEHTYKWAGWYTDSEGKHHCKVFSRSLASAAKGIRAWVRLSKCATEVTPVTVTPA